MEGGSPELGREESDVAYPSVGFVWFEVRESRRCGIGPVVRLVSSELRLSCPAIFPLRRYLYASEGGWNRRQWG